MSFEVGVVAHFTASHHLVGDFGPASLSHSHAYRVEVGVSGHRLGADGTLFDITRLQQAVAQVIADLDGSDLNDLSEIQLAGPNPTAEVIARFFFDRIAEKLSGQGLDQLQTRIWETPEAFASYSGDLARGSPSTSRN
jgi:6-pyruvoyltetrahydropterin/6-carboxytetrahydropterin synthase